MEKTRELPLLLLAVVVRPVLPPKEAEERGEEPGVRPD
jgi:hypothetical protein